MAKDKIIGLIVMILGILIAIVYTMGSVVDLWFSTWGGDALWAHKLFGEFIGSILSWELFVVLPLWLIVILISIIAIWIGYSMLTTPAPVPLEVTRSISLRYRLVGRGISCRRRIRGKFLNI